MRSLPPLVLPVNVSDTCDRTASVPAAPHRTAPGGRAVAATVIHLGPYTWPEMNRGPR